MGKVIKSKHGYAQINISQHSVDIEQDVEDRTVLIMLTQQEAVELANYILDNVDLCRYCGSELPCYCEREE